MSDKLPLVSIVTLNFNNGHFTEKCLSSLFETDYPKEKMEIVTVDNGSTDGSIDEIERKFSDHRNIKIIRSKRNLGFSEGNNIGARAARGDFFVILSNDTEVHKSWLRELIRFMKEHPKVGVAQCKILELKDRKTIQLIGSFFVPWIGWTFPLEGRGIVDKGQYDGEYRRVSASGAALAISRECYNKIGLFDKDYFICYEDMDVSLRTFLAGYETVVATKSIIYHHDHMSNILSPYQHRMRLYVSYRNCLLTIIKNFEAQNVIRWIPVTIISLFVHSLLFTIKNKDFYGIWAFLKAVIWNVVHFPGTLKKRNYVQKNIRVCSDKIAFAGVVRSISLPEVIRFIRQGLV